MKPIQYFTHQQSNWFNVQDYTQLLLDTNTILPIKPVSLYKRKRQSKTPEQLVMDRVKQSNPAYQLEVNQEVYANWVIFEYIYRLLKPFLVQPADWTNPDSLFRQLQFFIDHPKRQPESRGADDYFTKIQFEPPD